MPILIQLGAGSTMRRVGQKATERVENQFTDVEMYLHVEYQAFHFPSNHATTTKAKERSCLISTNNKSSVK